MAGLGVVFIPGHTIASEVEASGAVGALAISLAFGFIVAALVYALGPISGCHINPAVTLSVWAAGGIPAREAAGYIFAQMAGALAGAGLLVLLLLGREKGYNVAVDGLGQTGWAFILGLVVLATARKRGLRKNVARHKPKCHVYGHKRYTRWTRELFKIIFRFFT